MNDNIGVVDNRFLAKSLGILDPVIPIMLPETSCVKEVIHSLQQNNIGCIILTDTIGHLKGIFTERDILRKIIMKDVDLEKTSISKFMTTKPQTASMTTTIAFAINMMSDGGFRHIPIVDEESFPVGIVSVKDIVDFIAKSTVKELSKI